MSSTTRSNVWPKRQSDDVVHLINLYFVLVDSKEPSAGPRLADEVFAKNGRWFAAAGYVEGHDSIATSRTKAWDTINSQKHRLLRVFLNDADGLDMLLVGVADVELKNSEHITREFLVRAVIITEDGQPRIKFWQPVLAKPSPSEQPILAAVDP